MEPPAGSAPGPVVIVGSALERWGERLPHGGGIDAQLAQHGDDDARVLLEQHGEQVLRGGLGITPLVGQLLGGLQRLLRLDRKTVWLHVRCSSGLVRGV